ncbi:MAG: DUF4281 domain-containing protein [Candidatus Pelagibacter sp. TMED239]|nr:MAG: DUF4281 domain-containing protein [Candidatus Pelagibacter sp. TMED239]
MPEQISTFFTIDMIYLWLNIGVIPFWLILMFFPNSKVCGVFVSSIFPIFTLSIIYLYLIYYFFISGYNFEQNFSLYLGLDSLTDLFSERAFLIIFWTHFLSINLFCGSWIVSDSRQFSMNKIIIFIPLVITYFTGPLGIFIYWLIRIFYAKKISLYN